MDENSTEYGVDYLPLRLRLEVGLVLANTSREGPVICKQKQVSVSGLWYWVGLLGLLLTFRLRVMSRGLEVNQGSGEIREAIRYHVRSNYFVAAEYLTDGINERQR